MAKYRSKKQSSNLKQFGILLILGLVVVFILGLTNINQVRKFLGSRASTGNELKAFPGAEGFGTQSLGGRGGKVYIVSNLNDSGPGSLRECATASGARTCVFSVGGTISLNSSIEVTQPYLTIAGQTARGDGITIKSANEEQEAALKIKTHDVIVRYMRFRPGTVRQDLHTIGVNAGSTATGTAAAHNIVFDHVSISWGGDEMLILYSQSHDITVQWSSISESLPAAKDGSVAIKGIILGSDNGPGNYTFHHNLLAHNHQRNPNVDVAGVVDWSNNVVYNWNFSGANLKLSPKVNFINNYVKPGPNTADNSSYIKLTTFTGGYYVSGNQVDTSVKNGTFAPGTGVPSRYTAPMLTIDSAQTAYTKVLNEAGNSRGLNCDGSWFNRPDAVDVRIAQSVREGTRGHNLTQTYNNLGYISKPSDVGGWPVLDQGTPCDDADRDGMPDLWEDAKGLNKNVSDHSGDADGDGYTNLEEYMNGTNPKVSDTGIGGGNPVTQTPSNTPTIGVPTITPIAAATSTPIPSWTRTPATPTVTRAPTLTRIPTTPTTTGKLQTVRMNPAADTHVKTNAANRNFGSEEVLEVDKGIYTYLKFNLNQFKGRSIKAAYLRIYVNNPSRDKHIVRISNYAGWDEDEITYNSRLIPAGNAISFYGEKEGQIRVNITDFVKQKSGQSMSLVIEGTGTNGFDFYSKEADSNKVSLVVEYY